MTWPCLWCAPAMATGHLGCSAIEVFGFSRMVLPPHDALKTFDREMLMRIRQELVAHKRKSIRRYCGCLSSMSSS